MAFLSVIPLVWSAPAGGVTASGARRPATSSGDVDSLILLFLRPLRLRLGEGPLIAMGLQGQLVPICRAACPCSCAGHGSSSCGGSNQLLRRQVGPPLVMFRRGAQRDHLRPASSPVLPAAGVGSGVMYWLETGQPGSPDPDPCDAFWWTLVTLSYRGLRGSGTQD